MSSEPKPGEYRRSTSPRTDWLGNPDPSAVDIRWCTPEGRLTWAFGVDEALLSMIEAKLSTLTTALETIRDFPAGDFDQGTLRARRVAERTLNSVRRNTA